jgi:hypothetical protein
MTKKGRTRTVAEARELDRDAEKSHATRKRVKRVTGEPVAKRRGGLGTLAQSQRDGHAWVGHTSTTALFVEAYGYEPDED